MKVLIAPDKFKGSLTALEVASYLASGLRQSEGIRCQQLPLADGGDGSVLAAIAAGYRAHAIDTVGPTGQPVRAEIAFDGHTAVVEVANTCGLNLLPSGQLEPLNSSSFGFGQAILAALALEPVTIVLALGGSASTDGGSGMLSALGAAFTDESGQRIIGNGAQLISIVDADLSRLERLRGYEWVVASDVEAPLFGPGGAARVFGPQKGASEAVVAHLDRGLRNFASRCDPATGSLAGTPGAGSAGGLGFAGLLLGARMVSGADYFLELLSFDEHVADADIVITGEGQMDDQTLQGKLPLVVAQRSAPRPVMAVVGRNVVSRDVVLRAYFTEIHQISSYTDADSAGDPTLSGTVLTRIGESIGRSLVNLRD